MREEWDMSRTRKGPVANTKQRRDSSSNSSTNSTTATRPPSPHTNTICTPISTIRSTRSTHCPWRRSIVGGWRGTKPRLQWSTPRNILRLWASPSVPACTTARCRMEMRDLERGVRLPCPPVEGRARCLGQWGVEGAATAGIWGPTVVVAAQKRR